MIALNDPGAVWILLANGNNDGDANRFAMDVKYGFDSIVASGVAPAQVLVLYDTTLLGVYLQVHGLPPSCLKAVGDAASAVLKMRTSGFVGLLVTGHGGHSGIATTSPTTATTVLQWVRSVHGAQRAAIVLCQCYAGSFRYVEARGPVPTCVIGATNFEPSLSMQGVPAFGGPTSWVANPFLVYFADWIRSPVDIDGDNSFTLLDAFRHSSLRTMDHLQNVRAFTAYNFEDRIIKARAEIDGAPDPAAAQVRSAQLETDSFVLFGRPEPWIMFPDNARAIERR